MLQSCSPRRFCSPHCTQGGCQWEKKGSAPRRMGPLSADSPPPTQSFPLPPTPDHLLSLRDWGQAVLSPFPFPDNLAIAEGDKAEGNQAARELLLSGKGSAHLWLQLAREAGPAAAGTGTREDWAGASGVCASQGNFPSFNNKNRVFIFFFVIPGGRQEQQGTFQTILFSSKRSHRRNTSPRGKDGVCFPEGLVAEGLFGVSPSLRVHQVVSCHWQGQASGWLSSLLGPLRIVRLFIRFFSHQNFAPKSNSLK